MAADNLGLLVSDPHSVDIKATKSIGLSHRPIDSFTETERLSCRLHALLLLVTELGAL